MQYVQNINCTITDPEFVRHPHIHTLTYTHTKKHTHTYERTFCI